MIVAGAMILIAAGCHHKTADDYLAEGDADMQSTKLPEAEMAYLEAAKIAPNDPRVHIALGNLYVFEHKPGDAQIEFMKVLEIDPKNAATHVALGNLYGDQNQRGLAENQYRAAVALEPDRDNYHLDLGEVLRQEGKTAAAEDQIRTAIGLNPKDAKAHLALANLLASEPGRAAEANAEFDEVRALDTKLMPAPAATAAVDRAAGRRAATATASAPAPGVAPQIKPLNKLFLLTKNSPVYQNPDADQFHHRPGTPQEVRSRHRHRRRLSADQAQERHGRLHPGVSRGVDAPSAGDNNYFEVMGDG